MSSPNTSLQQEVAATLQTNASLQEGLESVTLTVQAVNDVGTRLDERSLKHVRQQGKDGVEWGEVGRRGGITVLDAGEELSQDGQIQDERGSQERILFK